MVSICIFQLQGCGGQKNNKIEVINIGYQSVTAQTWGALIMKDSKSFEKKLKNKFPVDIEWGMKNNKLYILQVKPIVLKKEIYK